MDQNKQRELYQLWRLVHVWRRSLQSNLEGETEEYGNNRLCVSGILRSCSLLGAGGSEIENTRALRWDKVCREVFRTDEICLSIGGLDRCSASKC